MRSEKIRIPGTHQIIDFEQFCYVSDQRETELEFPNSITFSLDIFNFQHSYFVSDLSLSLSRFQFLYFQWLFTPSNVNQ